MTENGLSTEERLEQLRSRKSTPATKPRKTHAALGSRIATAGIGASAMLAMVTTIDLANQPVVPPTPVERPVTVVVHQQPASTTTTTATDPVTASLAPTSSLPAAPATNGPIQLTATPVVTTIFTTAPSSQGSAPTQPAPAPVAQTNGS